MLHSTRPVALVSQALGLQPPQDEPAPRTLTYATSNPYELRFGVFQGGPKRTIQLRLGNDLDRPREGSRPVGPDSAYLQTLVMLQRDASIPSSASHGIREYVVARVRMFVTRREDTEAVGRALKGSLGDVRPAAAMIVGALFVDEDMKVKILLFWSNRRPRERGRVVVGFHTLIITALYTKWYNCMGDAEYKYRQLV